MEEGFILKFQSIYLQTKMTIPKFVFKKRGTATTPPEIS